MQNAKKALQYVEIPDKPLILDVGGRNNSPKDRSYRSLFGKNVTYWVTDIEEGPNVDIVMKEYEVPWGLLSDGPDLVISGQVAEHVRNPFRWIAELKRILKPGGYMILIAPSAGPNHDKVDCWRFMRDSWQAIAEECGLSLVKSWIYTGNSGGGRGRKWDDHTAVLKKLC